MFIFIINIRHYYLKIGNYIAIFLWLKKNNYLCTRFPQGIGQF